MLNRQGWQKYVYWYKKTFWTFLNTFHGRKLEARQLLGTLVSYPLDFQVILVLRPIISSLSRMEAMNVKQNRRYRSSVTLLGRLQPIACHCSLFTGVAKWKLPCVDSICYAESVSLNSLKGFRHCRKCPDGVLYIFENARVFYNLLRLFARPGSEINRSVSQNVSHEVTIIKKP